MKKVIALFLMIVPVLLFAQQNFFNVVSSDITPYKKVFFQQQFNATTAGLQFNSTLDIGLGKNFEIGVNFLGLNYDFNQKKITTENTNNPKFPFFMINAQKKFVLNEYFSLSIGTQLGFSTVKKPSFGNYSYFNAAYKNEQYGVKAVAGLYYGTHSFLGDQTLLYGKSPIGLQFGIEKVIIKEKFSLQADYISGQHILGAFVVGGAYIIKKHYVLSAGMQIPNYNSIEAFGGIVEFTYVP